MKHNKPSLLKAHQHGDTSTVKISKLIMNVNDFSIDGGITTKRDFLEGFRSVFTLGEPELLLGGELGRGASGTVFAANEVQEPARQVAVKLRSRPVDSSDLDVFIERCESEARVWSQFQANPHVVQLYYLLRQRVWDGGTESAYVGYVMEYSPLGDLQKRLQTDKGFLGILPQSDSSKLRMQQFLLRLALALEIGHDQNITHGDLKSNNVLLFNQGVEIVPKLIDFGISWTSDSNDSRVMGTPEYMARELFERFDSSYVQASADVARERRLRKASDVYSLGILFWEIITGSLPFRPPSGVSEQQRRNLCRAFHQGVKWKDASPTAPSESATVDLRTPWQKIENLGFADLLEKMLNPDWQRRDDINAVVQRLKMMEDEAVVLMTSAPPPSVVQPNNYRWHPSVHQALKQRLLYYFIKGRRPLGDPVWIENNLKAEGVTGFSIYRLLGGFDYLLRSWVTNIEEERLKAVLSNFQAFQQGSFQRFEVDENGITCLANLEVYQSKVIEPSDLVEKFKDIHQQCQEHRADPAKYSEREYNLLHQGGFAVSKLHHSDKSLQTKWPMRVFMAVSATGNPSDFWMRSCATELAKNFSSIPDCPIEIEGDTLRAKPSKSKTQKSALRSLSVYQGRGEFRFLLKFRIGQIHNIARVYERFFTVASMVQNEQTVLSCQTYVEVCGMERLLNTTVLPESDDGSLVRSISQQMAKQPQPRTPRV